MGRLIRKKPTAKPKKKNVEPEPVQPFSEKPREGVKKHFLSVAKTQNGGNKPAGLVQTAVTPLKGGLGKDNFITKSLQFLREVKIELKKVSWPSRKQALGSTGVVIVLVIIISLFLGLVDVSLSSLIRMVIR